MLHARRNRLLSSVLAAVTLLVLGSLGCRSPSIAARAVPADTAPRNDGTPDLAITFDPRITGDVGWTQLPERLPFEYLGSPGLRFFDASASRLPSSENIPEWDVIFAGVLDRLDLPATSLIVDSQGLCNPVFQAAVARARPARLLVSIPSGLTPTGATCLAALATPKLYLAGCLFRTTDPAACRGDDELATLLSTPDLGLRIHGLAISLARRESVQRLSELPALEVLALSPGAANPTFALVDALPFAALKNVRYLEAAGENGHADAWDRDAGRFLANLRSLRWYGDVPPLPSPCRLVRVSGGRLRDTDVAALASCTDLEELSTDQADVSTADGVAVFPNLRWLHLRHWHAASLAPLTALHHLERLSIPGSHATDFTFLSQMSSLRELELSFATITDLTPLSALRDLLSVDLDFSNASDLSPLRACRGLERLSVHETEVVDLSVVRELPALRELTVSKTRASDLSPLRDHPSLERVTLYDSAVTDVSALLTLKHLKRVHVAHLTLPADQLAALQKRLGDQLIE